MEKSPVGGGQRKRTDMLPLSEFMALEAYVLVEIFACLCSQFGRGIVSPCEATVFFPAPVEVSADTPFLFVVAC